MVAGKIEKEMEAKEGRVRLECRRQYNEEGTTECPSAYKRGTFEGLTWDSEALKIWIEYAQSGLNTHY